MLESEKFQTLVSSKMDFKNLDDSNYERITDRTIYRYKTQSGLWVRSEQRTDESVNELMEKAGWLRRYRESDWAKIQNLDEEGKAELQSYLYSLKRGIIKNGFYITGAYGTGKTSIMALIAKDLLKHTDNPMLFLTPITLGNSILAERSQVLAMYQKTSILFIDDFGFTRMTDYVAEMWRELMEYRYSEDKLTFCTSNLTIQDIAEIPAFERIASQLSDTRWMQQFILSGIDCRKTSENFS